MLKTDLRRLSLSECYGQAGPPASLSRDPTAHSGATFLSIFDAKYPLNNDLNKAMLYAVGPKGEGCTGPKRQDESYLTEAPFTSMLKGVTNNLVRLINYHNETQLTNQKPLLTNVRWCLLSGGSYRHKKISKVEVAKTI